MTLQKTELVRRNVIECVIRANEDELVLEAGLVKIVVVKV